MELKVVGPAGVQLPPHNAHLAQGAGKSEPLKSPEDSKLVPHLKIYIEAIAKPGRYMARLDSPQGSVLVTSTRQPLLDGCRALLAKGITGPVEMWDAVRPYPRMRADIEKAAKLTIEETDVGLRVRPWRPFARGAGMPKLASDGSDGE